MKGLGRSSAVHSAMFGHGAVHGSRPPAQSQNDLCCTGPGIRRFCHVPTIPAFLSTCTVVCLPVTRGVHTHAHAHAQTQVYLPAWGVGENGGAQRHCGMAWQRG